MTDEILVSVAGVLISLVCSYVPGVSAWFARLTGDQKRLVMLGALAVSALGVFGLACLGRSAAVACDTDGAWQLVQLFVTAAIANQSAYMLTPKS